MQIHANLWPFNWSHWKVVCSNILFLYVIPFLASREASSFYNMPAMTEVLKHMMFWQNELLISAQLGFYHRIFKVPLLKCSPISYSEKLEVRWSDCHSSSLFWSLIPCWFFFLSFQVLKKNSSANLMTLFQSSGTQVSLP